MAAAPSLLAARVHRALALLALVAPTTASVLIGRPAAPISPRAFVVSRSLSAEALAASSNPCCVLVANVSWDVGVPELREAMERRFGKVADVWLAPAGSGRHKTQLLVVASVGVLKHPARVSCNKVIHQGNLDSIQLNFGALWSEN